MYELYKRSRPSLSCGFEFKLEAETLVLHRLWDGADDFDAYRRDHGILSDIPYFLDF